MKSPASISDLHYLERRLLEQRELVEARLETLLGRSEDECRLALKEDVFGPEEEDMLAELDAGFRAGVLKLRTDLMAIEAALTRHAMKTYGVCGACGQAMSVELLLSQPAAVHCESCEAAAQAPVASRAA